MKKLLLSLSLIVLTAQAMEYDEEAAVPTEQEQLLEEEGKAEEMQVEKQKKLNERVKRVSCCRKLRTRLKKCPCYEISMIGGSLIVASIFIYGIWA